MANRITLLAGLACFTIALGCGDSTAPRPDLDLALNKSAVADNEVVPNSYIVMFANRSALKREVIRSRAQDHARRFGGRLTFVYGSLGGYAIDNLPPSAVAALSKLSEVEYVEPNYIVKAGSFRQVNPGAGLDRVDQRSLPLNNEFNYAFAGEGVHIYIVDSGIDTTSGEWSGRIGNGITCFGNIPDSRTAYVDSYNHGTAVASVAAGTTFGIAKFATRRHVNDGGD
jgi:hypothetical protein